MVDQQTEAVAAVETTEAVQAVAAVEAVVPQEEETPAPAAPLEVDVRYLGETG
jgi:hypothetical protein